MDVSDVADATQAAALSTLEDAMFGPLLIADVKGHKHECGKHVRPEETPANLGAAPAVPHRKHRRYPTPRRQPSSRCHISQPAASSSPGGAGGGSRTMRSSRIRSRAEEEEVEAHRPGLAAAARVFFGTNESRFERGATGRRPLRTGVVLREGLPEKARVTHQTSASQQ